MKRRSFLHLAATATIGAVLPSRVPADPNFPQGEIDLPQISGATLVGDRLLLTTRSGVTVALLADPVERLRSGSVNVAPHERLDGILKQQLNIEDLEAACWNGAETAYAVTSHSRDVFGETPEPRYRLARLTFDDAGKVVEARESDALLQGIVNELPFLADSVRRTAARTGLNIEGVAWDPQGHLVFGLRSPTVTESTPRPHGGQEDAVILRVLNPTDLFGDRPERARFAPVLKLDLRGQGIWDMAYDEERQGFWLLSGLSPEPTHDVIARGALWFWNGDDAPRKIAVPESVTLQQPTAACVIPIAGKNHLLLAEGGKTRSRYALLPPPSTAGL